MNNPIFNELKNKIVNNQVSLPPFLLLMNNWSYFNEALPGGVPAPLFP